jgi:hypothetical protein
MNMVEIWFGILTNQAVRRGSFDSVAQLIGAIKAFLARWNEGAKPFVDKNSRTNTGQGYQIMKSIYGTGH